MVTNLEKILNKIKSDKDSKLKPENIKYGTTILGVRGSLKPVQIDGNDVGLAIYAQDNTPEANQGVWLHTTKTYNHIYMENERHTTEYSMIYSDNPNDTTDDSNIIRGYGSPVNLMNCSYCQRNNVAHFFGYWSSTSSQNVDTLTCQHYKYDFDNNTWTKLSNCPTPQGGGGCVWTDEDTIYIIGTRHNTYYNYMYKYTISTDTWERLPDISVSGFTVGYMTRALFDNNHYVYVVNCKLLYRYDISTNEYLVISSNIIGNNQCITTTDRCGLFAYYNEGIYLCGANEGSNGYYANFKCYDISTGTVNSLAGSYKYGYLCGCTFGNHHIGEEQTSTLTTTTTRNQIYTFTNKTSISYIEKNNSGDTWSTYMFNSLYPTLYFITETMDLIFQPYGKNSYKTSKALILHDKTYEFEDNTLIIYTPDGTQGNYATELYRNEKVLNGVMKQKFNDVNLYDAEQDKIIKNIETYYGNGTNWVQIK